MPLQRAYQAQIEIVWNQVLYGRISKQWEQVATQIAGDCNIGQFKWLGKVIHVCWNFGLVLWKLRNELVHGTEGKISKIEEQRVQSLIRRIYAHKYDFGTREKWSEFPLSATVALRWTYETQVTFIDRLRFLYPEVMKQLETFHDIKARGTVATFKVGLLPVLSTG